MDGDRALLVFARYPVPGQVKTRLAAGVGKQAATTFYRACAEQIFAEADKVRAVSTVLYSAPGEGDLVQGWLASLGRDMRAAAQVTSSDLGERMHEAMRTAVEAGAQKVIVIGSDIPDLKADHIERAFELLEEHQVVLGPACDGGYYLVGVTCPSRDLFQGVTWSTSNVREATRNNAQRLGLTLAPDHALPTLQDIDTVEDLQAWFEIATAADPLWHIVKVLLAG